MDLSGLVDLLRECPALARLSRSLAAGGEHRLVALGAAKGYLVAALGRELEGPLLVITPGAEAARSLAEELACWLGPQRGPLLYPELEPLAYERLAADRHTVHERLRTLVALSGLGPGSSGASPVVVCSARALMQKTLDVNVLCANVRTYETGARFDPEAEVEHWVALGYEAAPLVELPGTFARRGGIFDIYPPQSEGPLRLELLGNRLESLRLFDPATQRSVALIPRAEVIPAKELVLPRAEHLRREALAALDPFCCRGEAAATLEQELAQLQKGHPFAEMEFWGPCFNDACLLDHLPDSALVVLDDPSGLRGTLEELASQAEEQRRALQERGELPGHFPRPYLVWSEVRARLERFGRRLALEPWATQELGPDGTFPLECLVPAGSYAGRLRVLVREALALARKGGRVVILTQQGQRLGELFAAEGFPIAPQTEIVAPPQPGSLTLMQGSLREGWVLREHGPQGHDPVAFPPQAMLLTDTEVFGFTKQRRGTKGRAVSHERFFGGLAVGDYVVHIEHGIGRFLGTRTMAQDGQEREYLVLGYAEGDKLYVPLDQVDRVSRYIGAREGPPALSRLGSQEWSRTKERVRRAVGTLARELLTLYAAREVLPGLAFSPDTVWQQELEASFPYVETPDQIQVLQEVKADMERPKPMDRLICGDVGYGKTEIALRAAFKAVMDGMQVAILVPTTVLAQQHHLTFTERLGAFPVRVEMLSRFRSEREQQQIVEGLREGSIDICIGTHRLVQRDIAFKNLGLVIIDEEQRFGVVHKERLKQMRHQVDILTLTATPIPRTLHMSLSGIRDLSTMETPPEDRLPIKTYVSPHEERLIREAILRELDRGGQVFFVHNRVQRIAQVAQRLQELVPEAEIAVGHGQMPEEELERVMLDFARGKKDILVCSSIIESGLDMPNVNTIIVDHADRFGLAQLYQLRGRVGRGANRAYAYLLYHGEKRLTETAEKRLRTIFEATELGAGFRIAMKDLEIRGAGNLLGAEQSGHIGAVGFDLYCRLLAQAVEQLRARLGRSEPATALPQRDGETLPLDLPLPAYIPQSYVEDLNLRLELYQRLAQASTLQEAEKMEQELRDRFGEPPPALKNLLYLARLRALARWGGVHSIAQEEGELVVRLGESSRLEPLREELGRRPGVRVGRTQVRLNVGQFPDGWQKVLEEVIAKVAKTV